MKSDNGKTCKVSVDTTDCRIQEPKGTGVTKSGKQLPFNPKWCSHKFKGAGVRYELAICIQTCDIVWLNGPYPCGEFNDIKIFKDKLQKKLLPNEKVEADGIYRGVDGVRSKGDFSSKSDLRAKAIARSHHETINGRLKSWACLREVWRHPLEKHEIAFSAVVVITQISFNIGEGPFQCFY